MRKFNVNPRRPVTEGDNVPVRKRRRFATGTAIGRWEYGGCLQYLLWLLLLLLLLLLLSWLLRDCTGRAVRPIVTSPGANWKSPRDPSSNGYYERGAPVDGINNPTPNRSVYPGNDWQTPRDDTCPGDDDLNLPHQGGRVLPEPEDNRIAPPPSYGGVKDPDQMKYVSPDKLNVILRSEGYGVMERWADKFKSIYPGSEHYINYYNVNTHMLQITVPAAVRETIKNGLNTQMPEFDFLVFDNDIFRRDKGGFPSLRRLFLRLNEKNWYLDAVQAVNAWEIEQGDSTVTVAVVDNMFDLSHPMIRRKVVQPYSVTRNSGDLSARFKNRGDSHGTHVAATAVGDFVEDKGTSGIAPGCKLMPVMIGNEGNDYLDIMSTLDGILYAIYAGADVINISAGISFTENIKRIPVSKQREIIRTFGKTEEKVWDYVYEAADKHNTVLVWAAGNDDILSGLDPSKRNNETIRVSAVDSRLRKSVFSNYGVFGPKEYYSTVSAPGEDIYNAFPNNQYGFMSGTSMASPIVTGAVALMKSLDKNLTTEEIITILQKTGKPVGDDIGRLIQIKDALSVVREGFLNYDDVLNHPESIIGLWKSTTPLFNTTSNAPIILYMRFFSSKEGELIIHENDSGHEFTAPLTVSVTTSGISIIQRSFATTPATQQYYTKYYYQCSVDEKRSVVCLASPQENFIAEDVRFNLRKIK